MSPYARCGGQPLTAVQETGAVTVRSSLSAIPPAVYFVRTMTVHAPGGTSAGTRAMSWLGLFTLRRRVTLCSVPDESTTNTPCASSASSTLILLPSMMMSSPIVSVPSVLPVAVSVMSVISALLA